MNKVQCLNILQIMSKKDLYQSLKLLKTAYPNKNIVSTRTIGQWTKQTNKLQN